MGSPRCHRGLRLYLRRGGKFPLVSAHHGNSGCPAISPWGRTWGEGWGHHGEVRTLSRERERGKREHGQLTSASSTRRPVKATTAAPSREIPVASSAMVSISSSIPAVSVSVSVAAVTPPVSARVHCPGLGGILCLCLLGQWIPGLIEVLMPENGARERCEFCSCLELLGWSWVHSLTSRTPVASTYRLVRASRMSQWTRSRALPGWSVSSPLVRGTSSPCTCLIFTSQKVDNHRVRGQGFRDQGSGAPLLGRPSTSSTPLVTSSPPRNWAHQLSGRAFRAGGHSHSASTISSGGLKMDRPEARAESRPSLTATRTGPLRQCCTQLHVQARF